MLPGDSALASPDLAMTCSEEITCHTVLTACLRKGTLRDRGRDVSTGLRDSCLGSSRCIQDSYPGCSRCSLEARSADRLIGWDKPRPYSSAGPSANCSCTASLLGNDLHHPCVLAITSPTPIKTPPKINKGVITSLRKSAPKIVPTTGCAKNVSEATAAGSSANA
jgi:hypothetical protein